MLQVSKSLPMTMPPKYRCILVCRLVTRLFSTPFKLDVLGMHNHQIFLKIPKVTPSPLMDLFKHISPTHDKPT